MWCFFVASIKFRCSDSETATFPYFVQSRWDTESDTKLKKPWYSKAQIARQKQEIAEFLFILYESYNTHECQSAIKYID